MRARTHPEDPVADGELGDCGADCLDVAGELEPEDPALRPEQAGEEAADEELGAAKAGVGPVDRRRADPDQHLVVFGDGLLDVLEPEDLRRSVPVVDDGSHRARPPFTTTTTFPVFCSGLDVPRRLDHVLQRVAPVDDGPIVPGLDELLEEANVVLRPIRQRHQHALVSDPRGQQRQREVPEAVRRDEDPSGLQRAFGAPERVLADRVEDDVVGLAVLREVFLRVVDHAVGPERSHELQVLRVADRSDGGAEVLGQLHRRRSDGA